MNQLIRKLLLSHLEQQESEFTTVYEGVISQAKPPYQTVYLQPTRTATYAISHQAHAQYSGYLQITLFAPLNQGTAQLDEQADRLCQHFYGQSLREGNLQILISSPPLAGGILTHDGQLSLPVTIYYQAYTL